MQHHRTPAAPRRPATKGCPACGETKPTGEFYCSRVRLSSYCKPCQRRVSNDTYRRRRQDATDRKRMRQRDRAANAPNGRAWPASTPTGNAAPERPVPPPSGG